jgi:hypothetical protein
MKRTLILLVTLLLPAAAGWTQETATATVADPPTSTTDWQSFDSRQTREDFVELLARHPREVGVLLKIDPSLFRNEAWLAPYPALREFIGKHPEVAQNQAYYLEHVWIPGDEAPESAETRVAREMMEGISIFAVMAMVIGGLVWLIRTLLEHRRWSRVSRVQTDIYNKLLDRFTSHEDLLRYVQSAAGKDFIQGAIAPISTGTPSPVSAPVSRILWSAQVGVILFAIGAGLQLVSGRLHADVSASVSTLGVLALCGGLGFAASAVVAWIVSRRLGILPDGTAEIETGTPRERTLGE